MAKVSGKEVANAILEKLDKEIKKKNLKPKLVIILAGNNSSSRIYVKNKIKKALEIGINPKLFEFSKNQFNKCLQTIKKLNTDKKTHGIIIQYPVFDNWDFDNLISKIDPRKDVDGFLEASPFMGATAMAVWEMLTAFSLLEGFSKTENFLKGKKIVVLGRGKTAGGPTKKLLEDRGFKALVITRDTKNPTPKIKNADVVISATGQKNIINSSNVKKGAYVIGVGFGDLNEEEISKIAKLYNPNIGGIGPLTIVSLLKNVVESAKGAKSGSF
ncbi:MAG: bifunctional 5,10-methylenetetrahydrofolate dehydrogenase/5,10-methenyltetrahydrofolate cyclohydrolase [Candidatus Daviesbacteria bacterium]|nr:bifunctional 5,10-methylenetetrahydrofolate dehydrogenase/5,10-methenyltetrahydrofolate cyclohydrolase [Candidatus Daviesbacteria bacterium]